MPTAKYAAWVFVFLCVSVCVCVLTPFYLFLGGVVSYNAPF